LKPKDGIHEYTSKKDLLSRKEKTWWGEFSTGEREKVNHPTKKGFLGCVGKMIHTEGEAAGKRNLGAA